jgi:hypothetical protein
MVLTRDQILECSDLKKEEVQVPEWGGSVFVREMNGADRNAWEASLINEKGKVNLVNIHARLVSFCVVDEKGNRIFSDADVDLLGKKSGKALSRIVDACQKLNKLTDKDLDEVKKP